MRDVTTPKRPVGRPRLPPGVAQTKRETNAKYRAKVKADRDRLRVIEAMITAAMRKSDGVS